MHPSQTSESPHVAMSGDESFRMDTKPAFKISLLDPQFNPSTSPLCRRRCTPDCGDFAGRCHTEQLGVDWLPWRGSFSCIRLLPNLAYVGWLNPQRPFRDSSSNLYSHIPVSFSGRKKLNMRASIDWTEIQPSKKWLILSKQKRFALWALYSSIGSMMLGKQRNCDLPNQLYNTC